MTRYAATSHSVVTWMDSRDNRISICRGCERRLRARGQWPRNPWTGEEYHSVHMGLHRGRCDLEDHGGPEAD